MDPINLDAPGVGFDVGFAPVDEGLSNLPLDQAAESLDLLHRILDAEVKSCLARAGVTKAACDACVRDAVMTALGGAKAIAIDFDDTLRQATLNVLSDAWSIAIELGCLSQGGGSGAVVAGAVGVGPKEPCDPFPNGPVDAYQIQPDPLTIALLPALSAPPVPPIPFLGTFFDWPAAIKALMPSIVACLGGGPPLVDCPPGYVYDPSAGGCVPTGFPPVSCPPGTVYSPGLGECVPVTPPDGGVTPPPPTGPTITSTPACVPECPPGMMPAPVSCPSPPVTVAPVECPPGLPPGTLCAGLVTTPAPPPGGTIVSIPEPGVPPPTGTLITQPVPVEPLIPTGTPIPQPTPEPGLPPTPPAATIEAATVAYGIGLPDWDDPDACKTIDQNLSTLGEIGKVSVAVSLGLRTKEGKAVVPRWLAEFVMMSVGATAPGQSTLMDKILFSAAAGGFSPAIAPLVFVGQLLGGAVLPQTEPLTGTLTSPVNTEKMDKGIALIINLASNVVRGFVDALDPALSAVLQVTGCPNVSLAIPFMAKLGIGLFDRWLGDGLADVKTQFAYYLNYVCPTFIPSTIDANSAFLANEISEETWRCWTRANNVREIPAKSALHASRTRPTPFEVVQLYYRGKLTYGDCVERLRSLGYLEVTEAFEQIDLYKQFPGPSDLIRFMLRDVFDQVVVADEKLDQEFTEKFTGKAPEWAFAQGMDEDTFKYFWRAHWEYPSPTQLFEMLHRLRPGRVDPEIQVTIDDVRRVLAINDLAPNWRDALAAISYAPLTRTDARRAHEIGLIGDQELNEVLQDVGYDEVNASRLVRFATFERRRKIASHRWTALYRRGGLPAFEAVDRLTRIGYPEEQVRSVLAEVDREVGAETQITCVGAVRKRYLAGEFDTIDLLRHLQEQGLEGQQAQSAAQRMECERAARAKTIPARTLCRWLEQGTITEEETVTRLVRLGYTPADALRVVGDCQAGIGKRRLAVLDKEARKAEAESRKRAKSAEQAVRDAMKTARAREALQAKREREQAQEAERRLKVAQKVAAKSDEQVETVRDRIEVLAQARADEIGRTPKQMWRAAEIAEKSYRGGDLDEFTPHFLDASLAEADVLDSLPLEGEESP